MYDYKNDLLLRSFFNMFETNEERDLYMILRNQNDYFVPRYRINLVSRLPLCSLPRAWNEFEDPNQIKVINPKEPF